MAPISAGESAAATVGEQPGSRAASPRRARRAGTIRSHQLVFWACLVVPLALYVVAYIYPVVDALVLSLHRWDGMAPEQTFVGLENYWSLFREPRFYLALRNNLLWLGFFLVVPTVVGLGLALLLDEDLPGAGLIRSAFFLPFTITTVAVAAIWRWLYEPNVGVIAATLRAIGLPDLAFNWLGNPATVNLAIMLANLWAWSGFTFLVFHAGVRSIPAQYVEAARIDGASPLTILLRIKLPLLWPSMIVVVGIGCVEAMRVFDLVYAMTQGGPYHSSTVLAVEMYETSFGRFDMGLGAANAVVLLVVSGIVVLPYLWYTTTRLESAAE